MITPRRLNPLFICLALLALNTNLATAQVMYGSEYEGDTLVVWADQAWKDQAAASNGMVTLSEPVAGGTWIQCRSFLHDSAEVTWKGIVMHRLVFGAESGIKWIPDGQVSDCSTPDYDGDTATGAVAQPQATGPDNGQANGDTALGGFPQAGPDANYNILIRDGDGIRRVRIHFFADGRCQLAYNNGYDILRVDGGSCSASSASGSFDNGAGLSWTISGTFSGVTATNETSGTLRGTFSIQVTAPNQEPRTDTVSGEGTYAYSP